MSRVSYVNGRYHPHKEVNVHVEDRGYQFADGVYEVILVKNRRLVDQIPHLDRLERSLKALEIPCPMKRQALKMVLEEVIDRNKFKNGIVYIQITRGVARRDHGFPKISKPTLVITARPLKIPVKGTESKGAKVITLPDIRWKRCDIKSVSLLPNVLGKQAARTAGAQEAWQYDEEGFITEGTSTNAWILDHNNNLITRYLDEAILSGVTRLTVINLAETEGIKIVEQPFSIDDVKNCKEAFFTSSTSFLTPVTQINDTVIGDGSPGEFTKKLLLSYMNYIDERTQNESKG